MGADLGPGVSQPRGSHGSWGSALTSVRSRVKAGEWPKLLPWTGNSEEGAAAFPGFLCKIWIVPSVLVPRDTGEHPAEGTLRYLGFYPIAGPLELAELSQPVP